MKKLFIAALLMYAQLTSADIVGFFDDTAKYGRTGVIQRNFPEVPLVGCSTFAACDPHLYYHYLVGVVFSDTNRMQAELDNRASSINYFQYIHSVGGKGFKIDVYDVATVEG